MNPEFGRSPILLNAAGHQAPRSREQTLTTDSRQTRMLSSVPFHVQDGKSVSSLNLNQGAGRAVLTEAVQVETAQTDLRLVHVQSTLQKRRCPPIILLDTEGGNGVSGKERWVQTLERGQRAAPASPRWRNASPIQNWPAYRPPGPVRRGQSRLRPAVPVPALTLRCTCLDSHRCSREASTAPTKSHFLSTLKFIQQQKPRLHTDGGLSRCPFLTHILATRPKWLLHPETPHKTLSLPLPPLQTGEAWPRGRSALWSLTRPFPRPLPAQEPGSGAPAPRQTPLGGAAHLVLRLLQLVCAARQQVPAAVQRAPLHRVCGVLRVHRLQQPEATARCPQVGGRGGEHAGGHRAAEAGC